MSIERRGHPRYDLMAQIRVKRGRVNYIMNVKNVSISGMFVTTERVKQMPWFRIGQNLEIDIFTTEELENVRLSGRIVRIFDKGRSEQKGFGVEFISIEKEIREKLSRLVDLASQTSIHPPPLPGPGEK
ncbi:MAG: PilZ domain-containing protein [Proteobacteria bacterium]|nr:PilZ domain-containing protein [Pseudomonadota bacterium]